MTALHEFEEMLERGDMPALIAAAYSAANARMDENPEGVWELRVDGKHFCFVEISWIPARGAE